MVNVKVAAKLQAREYIVMQNQLLEQERERARIEREEQQRQIEQEKAEKRLGREQEKAKREKKRVALKEQKRAEREKKRLEKIRQIEQAKIKRARIREQAKIEKERKKQLREQEREQEKEQEKAEKRVEREEQKVTKEQEKEQKRLIREQEREKKRVEREAQKRVSRITREVQKRVKGASKRASNQRKGIRTYHMATLLNKQREQRKIARQVARQVALEEKKAAVEAAKLARLQARQQTTKVKKAATIAEKAAAEAVKQAERDAKKQEREDLKNFKVLNVLTAVGYLTRRELCALVPISNALSFQLFDGLEKAGYIELVFSGKFIFRRITESGRHEYDRLEKLCGPIPSPIVETTVRQASMRRAEKCLAAAEKIDYDVRIKESFVKDKALRANEKGLRKYFIPDPKNPLDIEIVRRVTESGHEEFRCRGILCKRLSLGYNAYSRNADQAIENMLWKRCNDKGITRDELVRQLFCIHYNIKTVEVK